MELPMLPLGTKTQYGEIAAVGWVGERYYWMVSEGGVTSMIPADAMGDVVDENEQFELPLDGTLEGC